MNNATSSVSRTAYRNHGLIPVEERQKSGALPADTSKKSWILQMRPNDDDNEDQDWWWASTAIPLLAATIGPLANVMSIAALVTSWRNNYDPVYPGADSHSIGFPDPKWCLGLNGASLACGFAGNIFLLFNFTRTIRYIVALPMTIVLWYFATGIVSCSCIRITQIDERYHSYSILMSIRQNFFFWDLETSLERKLQARVRRLLLLLMRNASLDYQSIRSCEISCFLETFQCISCR